MVQNYSCAGSPFLMFLPFICLALPDDSPFWTAKENEGIWETLENNSHKVVLENPGLVLVNHGKTGTSEIIPGKVYYDDPNYSKLVYNTHFPWEDHNPQGGTSMEYSFRSQDPRDLRGDDVNFTSQVKQWKTILKKTGHLRFRKACFLTEFERMFYTGRQSCEDHQTMGWGISLIWRK